MNRKVIATVISKKGECIVGHRKGDRIIFRVDEVDGKICIHALYSMIPKVYAIYYDAKFPWLKEDEKPTHACPDPINPVVFQLEVVDET
jgi:uncharacterized repeat protein (TIGR04076 family)